VNTSFPIAIRMSARAMCGTLMSATMKQSFTGKGTFEMFNVWSRRPDWVLEAPGLRVTGTAAAPILPGPTQLVVAYLDEPKGYTYKAIASDLRVLRVDVSRVRVEGTVAVEDMTLAIELDAALVT
jgi:hypothetical protein